jgi:hypothetical protein
MVTSQEFHCVQCEQSVDLTIDLMTDENGKAVHENCYYLNLKKFTPPKS